jgi:hypothetical protein
MLVIATTILVIEVTMLVIATTSVFPCIVLTPSEP